MTLQSDSLRPMTNSYDTIGIDYSDLRKPDVRIATMIRRVLGAAKTVLNVGAGAGSYEPMDLEVTAVEPSAEMIRQRLPSAATVIQGHAEDLPFDDDFFDASMAINTVHHWTDKEKGIKEMRRVTNGPMVVLTYDPAYPGFWLTDYIPELIALDEVIMPKMTDYETWLGPVDITPVHVPHDCVDGFLYAYWRRPAAYLDPKIRAAMSSFWAMKNVPNALGQLERDLESGAWAKQNAELIDLDTYDVGYRLMISK